MRNITVLLAMLIFVNTSYSQVYLNQMGFNVGRPKRFTAPTAASGSSFEVMELLPVQSRVLDNADQSGVTVMGSWELQNVGENGSALVSPPTEDTMTVTFSTEIAYDGYLFLKIIWPRFEGKLGHGSTIRLRIQHRDIDTIVGWNQESLIGHWRPFYENRCAVGDALTLTFFASTDNRHQIAVDAVDLTIYSGMPVHEGTIEGNLGDFSAFDNGSYHKLYLVDLSEKGFSVPFKVFPHLVQQASLKPALDFMIDSRCGAECGGNCPDQYGWKNPMWKDAVQFGYELPSLVELYQSNPSVFLRWKEQELPVESPDIIDLIVHGVTSLLEKECKRPQLKAQLAHFLSVYPDIQEWVDGGLYEQAKEYAFTQWASDELGQCGGDYGVVTRTYPSNNLLQTFEIVGTNKGEFPPGNTILPNLLMYEVAKREGRGDSADYFKAAYDQTQWVIDAVDWKDPTTTKGQRVTEHATMRSLAYFQKNYPDRAPTGLYDKIVEWARVVEYRSDNLWDFRRYSKYPGDAPYVKENNDKWVDNYNEAGNVAGVPAISFAAAEIVKDTGLSKRLHEIAFAHIDDVFGRNPIGVHFDMRAAKDFPGVEYGWHLALEGHFCDTARGPLHSAPVEKNYPYKPGQHKGHAEGWVQHNTAWNLSLAHLNYFETEISFHDGSFTHLLQTLPASGALGIRLIAPLNHDNTTRETGEVVLVSDKGDKEIVVVTESSPSHSFFEGTITVSSGEAEEMDGTIQVDEDGGLEVRYGLGQFTKSVRLVEGGVVSSSSVVGASLKQLLMVRTGSGILIRDANFVRNVAVFDVQGRSLPAKIEVRGNSMRIHLGAGARSLYMIKVQTSRGARIHRFTL